jgi:hypothetical protein
MIIVFTENHDVPVQTGKMQSNPRAPNQTRKELFSRQEAHEPRKNLNSLHVKARGHYEIK